LNSGNGNAARNTLNFGNVNVDRGGGGYSGRGYYGDGYYGGYGRGAYFWGGYAAGAGTGAAAASNQRYYSSAVSCSR
jgi:hypothetical protein